MKRERRPRPRLLLGLFLCTAAVLIPGASAKAATLTATGGNTLQADLTPGDGALTISDSPLTVTFSLAAGTFTATPPFIVPCAPPTGASVTCNKTNLLPAPPMTPPPMTPVPFSFANLVVNGTTGVDMVISQVDEPAPSDTLASLDDGADTWTGSSGREVINTGGAGDTVVGGSGITGILGEAGDDPSLSGGGGNDSIDGGAGNDGILGDAGDDLIDGGANNDTISGGVGDDVIDPGTGSDNIDGGENGETLGDDLDYSGRFGALVVNLATGVGMGEAGENDTLTANGSIERVLGGSGNDQLTGDTRVNVLFGNGGADNLSGGDSADRLEGGAGNDAMLGGAGIDQFFAGDGDDLPNSQDGVAETVDCGAGNDTATSDAIDTLNACEGKSSDPGEAPQCKGKKPTIVGTSAGEAIAGTKGNDVIHALGGNDNVKAGAGRDIVCGGAGGDRLSGQAGNDQLIGGKGTDKYLGGGGKDRCNASSRERAKSC